MLQLFVRAFVLAAVQQDGYALEYATDALKADATIVLAAVQQHGHALYYAAEALQADLTIVTAAVRQAGRALEFATEESKRTSRDGAEATSRNRPPTFHPPDDFRTTSGRLPDGFRTLLRRHLKLRFLH